MNYTQITKRIQERKLGWCPSYGRHYANEPDSARRKVFAFLRKAGMPYDPRKKSDYLWDGKTLRADGTCSNLLHDLAHWQLASSKQRRLKEYGLGDNPDASYEKPLRMLVGYNRAIILEEYASALGICYEYHLGLSPGETYEYHNWDGVGYNTKFEDRLSYLYNKGYLAGDNCRPTFKRAK